MSSETAPWGWSLVLLGIVFKIFFTGRLGILSTMIYVAMGWLLLVGGRSFFAVVPTSVAVPVILPANLS